MKIYLSLALAVPLVACAQPAVTWTTNYYEVTGTTLREIHQSLRQNRPWKNTWQTDGYTRWHVQWNFATSASGGKCRLTSFNTRTTITITLPRWVTATNASDPVRAEWQRYITALGQHEAGHGQFALAAANEIQKRARETGENADCSALKQQINSLAQGIVTQYRAKEKEYDERTQHGATQGAVLQRRDGSTSPRRFN